MEPAAAVRERTDSQQRALDEFRTTVAEFAPEVDAQNDAFLLRWLVAREFNNDKARTMLKNYYEWREANEIEKILDWSPPEEMSDACPFQILNGTDLDGRPVLLFPWGKWKPWIFTEKFAHLYQKYMDYMINSLIATMKPPATQFVILGDSDGFTYAHMKYIKAVDLGLEAVRQFEAHYPEMMHSAIIINCPKAFTLLFTLVKPLMTHRTRNKMNIFSSDKRKWKDFLAQRIPQNGLPVQYRKENILDNGDDNTKTKTNGSTVDVNL